MIPSTEAAIAEVPGPDEILECVAVSQETREAVFGISADISSAHRLVSIRRADWPKLGCRARSSDRVVWMNTVGTFGISSAAYWWSRLFGCVGRWVLRLMMTLWAMQVIYVDDLHLVAAGPQKYLVIWMMIAAFDVGYASTLSAIIFLMTVGRQVCRKNDVSG